MHKKPISLSRFPAILTHREMAIIFAVDEKTVRKQCASGIIPAVRRGRDWEIHKDAFVLFMSGECRSGNHILVELSEQISELTQLVRNFVGSEAPND